MLPKPVQGLTTAVVVCGHAVYLGGPSLSPDEATADTHWHLQSFQAGEPPHYVAHVRAGVELAAADDSALLILSGGQTRHPHILSEAQGYHHLADVFAFWGHAAVRSRTTTEEFSRDSHDNVLFGIARFCECTGRLPEQLVVVSWTFKRARFELHAASIHWPSEALRFVGVGQPDDLAFAEGAEAKTLDHFQRDVCGYGADGGPLGDKKRARNPYARHHGYASSCPIMRDVLEWQGPQPISKDLTPWSRKSTYIHRTVSTSAT